MNDASERAVMLGVLIFRLKNRPDDIRIFLGVFTNDCRRPVGRRVVMNKHLKRETRFLHHKAVKALPEERLVIVNQALYSNQRRISHFAK